MTWLSCGIKFPWLSRWRHHCKVFWGQHLQESKNWVSGCFPKCSHPCGPWPHHPFSAVQAELQEKQLFVFFPLSLWLYLQCQWQPDSAFPGGGEAGCQGKEERWLTIFCALKFQALYFPPFQTLPFCFQLHWASFIPCSGSPLRTNVGYSGSISFNEKDGGKTDGDKASLWRRAACSALRLQGAEMGCQTCNFPWGMKVSLCRSLDPSHNFTFYSFCFISHESWVDF